MSTRRSRPAYVTPLYLETTDCGWSTPCQCPYHQQQAPEAVLTQESVAAPEMNCLRLVAQEYALARLRGDVAGMLRSSQMLTTLSLVLLNQATSAWQQTLDRSTTPPTQETLAAVACSPLLQQHA